MLDVCVVGTGYVGLVTGTCLAEIGHAVTCVDTDADKIGSLLAGRIPIYEPGLGELVGRNAARGRLRFTTDLAGAVAAEALVLVIAVGPQAADLAGVGIHAGDGVPDLRQAGPRHETHVPRTHDTNVQHLGHSVKGRGSAVIAGSIGRHRAPLPNRTAGRVWRRMYRSIQIDQFRM